MSISDDIKTALDLDAKATGGPWDYVESDDGMLGGVDAIERPVVPMTGLADNQDEHSLQLIASYRTLAPRLAAWAQQVMPLVEAGLRLKKAYEEDDDMGYEDAACAMRREARALNLEVPNG